MSVPDADDDPLVLFMQFDETLGHELVAVINQCPFDRGELLSDLLKIGIIVGLVILHFRFHTFLADEQAGDT